MKTALQLTLALFVLSFSLASAQTTTNTFYACTYSGGDIGAKINAAETAAGSAPADIWVNCSGTVSTVPTIKSNTRLIIDAALTWSVSPVLNNNTQIVGTGQQAVQTVHLNSAWITATSLLNVTVDNLWVTNTYSGAGIGATLLHCSACTGILMKNNYLVGIGLLTTGTTASSYSGVTSSNISYRVTLNDNVVDGQGNQVVLAYLTYVNGVVANNNKTYNALYNVEWWGGDASAEGLTTSNPRWATDIAITGGVANNVTAGFWGSMGEDITVTGVTVDTCSDVGLDAEGSFRVVFSGFAVHNCTNGGLATFYASQNINFGPGTVTSDAAASYSLARFNNSTLDPTKAVAVKVHNTKFICNDDSTLCGMTVDPIGGFQFANNEVTNATLALTQGNISGFRILANSFTYTYVPSSTFNAVSVVSQISNYLPTAEISRNTFWSASTQPAGTYAINATDADYNDSDILYVKDNVTHGFTNDATFLAASGNAGITPTFVFSGNVWGNNSVTTTVSGAHGSFIMPTFGTPVNSSASCVQGQIELDSSYIYTCVARNTWRRVATSAF